jgi:hypothetical protein
VNRFALGFGLSAAALAVALIPHSAVARPQYARQVGQQCSYCHLNARGGGPRNFRGVYFGANNLSLTAFDEAREAALARVEPESTGSASAPKVGYVPYVDGATDKRIQSASLNGPVVVIWLDPKTSDVQKSVAKTFGKLVDSVGANATVMGIIKGDRGEAIQATTDYENAFRILGDTELVAAKKFGATNGLDFALIGVRGKFIKLWKGYSQENLMDLRKQLALAQVESEGFEGDEEATKVVRGAKLGQ